MALAQQQRTFAYSRASLTRNDYADYHWRTLSRRRTHEYLITRAFRQNLPSAIKWRNAPKLRSHRERFGFPKSQRHFLKAAAHCHMARRSIKKAETSMTLQMLVATQAIPQRQRSIHFHIFIENYHHHQRLTSKTGCRLIQITHYRRY